MQELILFFYNNPLITTGLDYFLTNYPKRSGINFFYPVFWRSNKTGLAAAAALAINPAIGLIYFRPPKKSSILPAKAEYISRQERNKLKNVNLFNLLNHPDMPPILYN
jgi:hypothetical protein